MRRFEFWSPSTNLSRSFPYESGFLRGSPCLIMTLSICFNVFVGDLCMFRVNVFIARCHCVALDVEGRCYTWGRNEKGQLSHGDIIQRDRPTKENKQLDTEIHVNYIYDGHVSNYMKMLNEDQPEKFQTHFSQYLKKGVDAEGMEELVLVL
ncbi:unnamed protein product [Brassica oleracea var. botrytis]